MTARGARRLPQLSLAVQYAAAARNLPARAQVRKWVRAALEHEAEVTVRIVGSPEGRALNRHFRGRDYATNVLTFVMKETPPYAGDLVLCAPVVAREARAQRKRVTAHYAHLVVHGMLHLHGYDHEHEAEARVMEARESRIMIRLGYPDPYGGETRDSGPQAREPKPRTKLARAGAQRGGAARLTPHASRLSRS